jgi:hypothetical protein
MDLKGIKNLNKISITDKKRKEKKKKKKRKGGTLQNLKMWNLIIYR